MSVLDVRDPISLEDAIQQMINLGEKDPMTIADRCASLHGSDWVANELAAHWREIFAEIARQHLGNERRAAVTSIAQFTRVGRNNKPAKREVVLQSLYIPGKGWIGLGEATTEDLSMAAAYRRRLADGLYRWADWLDALNAQLSEQGVKRVRDLKGQLPSLPTRELEEGAA